MRWNKRTISKDERIVMLTKYLITLGGRRVDLHKIVAEDYPGFFHSHPANAFRIVLWGWYVEQRLDGTMKFWSPGMMGFVPGQLFHRFEMVSNPTYTLWFRGKDKFKIRVKQWH